MPFPHTLRQSSIQEPLPQHVFNPNTTLPGTTPNHVRSGAGSEETRRGEPGSEQKEARRGKIDLFSLSQAIEQEFVVFIEG